MLQIELGSRQQRHSPAVPRRRGLAAGDGVTTSTRSTSTNAHRYDCCDHLIESVEGRPTARCAYCTYSSSVGFWCPKCRVYLHAKPCFKAFHTRYIIIFITVLTTSMPAWCVALTCCATQGVGVGVFLHFTWRGMDGGGMGRMCGRWILWV